MFKKYFSTIMMTIAFLVFIIPNILAYWPLSGDIGRMLIGCLIISPLWILVMGMKETEIGLLIKQRDTVLERSYEKGIPDLREYISTLEEGIRVQSEYIAALERYVHLCRNEIEKREE